MNMPKIDLSLLVERTRLRKEMEELLKKEDSPDKQRRIDEICRRLAEIAREMRGIKC